MEYPKSIKVPKTAVPNAVDKTISDVDNALIDPKYLTPYISAQSDDNNTLDNPLVTPIKNINMYAE